jgi:methyl-accepting chemotaxis protein
MFKNMKLSVKLIAGFLLVAAITAVVGSVGVFGLMNAKANIYEIGVVRLPSVASLLTISEAQTAVDSAENALLAKNIDGKGRNDAYARFDAAQKRADDGWKIYEPLPQTEEEAATWKQFVPAWEKWWKDHETYVSIAKEYEKNPSEELYNKMSVQALETNGISFSAAETLLNKLVEINTTIADEAVKTANATVSRSSIIMITSLVVGVCVAGFLGIFLSMGISRPINRIINGLTEGAEQVSSAAGQVSSASQSLAEGATEQAAGLEETSSSLEEMSSMTKQNADNAQQANTLAAEAKKAANDGSEAMTRMDDAIKDIQKSSDETAKIIKVIDEIAFQTNLLALNAAVEAARAGEAGKGFAVVAEEVRNLAMRSAEAAKNTSNLIEQSVNNSRNGVQICGEVKKSLDEIVGSIGKTTALVGEIAAASNEQAQGVDQINTAVSQMDKVTQQNAANAEESASASEELSAQAESMAQIVDELVALVNGSSAQKISTRTAAHHDIKKKEHHLTHLDQTFHQIASGSTTAKEHKVKAQGHAVVKDKAKSSAVLQLPLDEGELKDFNG